MYIAGSMTALAAWSMLSNIFEAKGPIRIVSAHCKLFGTRCTEESNIEDHICIMRIYQQELATLQKPISEEDFSYALLTSLPESWNNFISAVPEDIIKDPTKLISRMLSELQRLREQARSSTALAVIDKSTAKCYTCGCIGHFASDHGKQVNREKEKNEKQNDDKKEKKKKEKKGRNRWKKEKGKNSQANLAQNDLDVSDDEDSMFLVWDPTLVQSLQPDDWILDSGCSHSIVHNKNNFSLYISTSPHKISGISDTSSSGHGNIPLSFALSSSIYACVLRDVLHCPSALFNLISVSQLTDAGYTAIFKDDKVELHSRKGMLLAVGDKISRLYQLCLAGFTDCALVACTWDEWHHTFGHLNMKSLHHLKTHNMVNRLEVHNENADLHQCKACLAGKSHVQPFLRESQHKYTKIGEMTYTDLFGKVDQKGPRGEHYFILFTNAAKAHSHINFLKTKEANVILDAIKKYVAFIFTQTRKKVKCFHFDDGKEYINQEVLDWLKL